MKIFLSWSGPTSHRLAKALHEWLPIVLHQLDPWISSKNIAKGQRWSPQLASILDETSCGIICLCPGNLHEPWVLFEAGALAKSVESGMVAPLLFGVTPEQAPGPLQQFQATSFAEDEVLQLMLSINDGLGDRRSDPSKLHETFKVAWPKLQSQIDAIDLDPSPPSTDAVSQPSGDFGDGLSPEQIQILVALSKSHDGSLPAHSLAAESGLSGQLAAFHLEGLEDGEYISSYIDFDEPVEYILGQKGRHSLNNRGLLK